MFVFIIAFFLLLSIVFYDFPLFNLKLIMYNRFDCVLIIYGYYLEEIST